MPVENLRTSTGDNITFYSSPHSEVVQVEINGKSAGCLYREEILKVRCA